MADLANQAFIQIRSFAANVPRYQVKAKLESVVDPNDAPGHVLDTIKTQAAKARGRGGGYRGGYRGGHNNNNYNNNQGGYGDSSYQQQQGNYYQTNQRGGAPAMIGMRQQQ